MRCLFDEKNVVTVRPSAPFVLCMDGRGEFSVFARSNQQPSPYRQMELLPNGIPPRLEAR